MPRVERAEVASYLVYILDKRRTAAEGGNRRALHRHTLFLAEGEAYNFVMRWSGKLVHAGESVSFDWDWDATGRFYEVDVASLIAYGRDGSARIRGERQ